MDSTDMMLLESYDVHRGAEEQTGANADRGVWGRGVERTG